MAGTILFPSKPHWTVGSHGFFPVIDRIRAAVPDTWRHLVGPLFEPIDQGFQFIALDEDVTPEAFHAFYRVTVQEYRRCLGSEAEARMPEGYYSGIMECWTDLIGLLEADPRSRGMDAPIAGAIN
jgi:hypothetical protein